MERVKCNRGFANMSPERRKAIAAKGGANAHKRGTAHKFTPLEARNAADLSIKVRRAKARAKKRAEKAARTQKVEE